jgi:hypothetical protein
LLLTHPAVEDVYELYGIVYLGAEKMSTLLFSLARENPWPGLAVASLNLVVALSLVGLSLLLGATIALLAWLHALVERAAVPIKRRARRRRATP